MLHPVIMAGGAGTRFWPRSRRHRPKQLIRIFGEGSMIQQTVSRLQPAFRSETFLVVTHAAQAEETRRQLPQLSADQVVAEPCGRDTAPCIGLAALLLLKSDPEAVMAVLASDQMLSPSEEFVRCIAAAEKIATREKTLVTFGVRPSHPSELYGYIRRGRPLESRSAEDPPAFRVAEFREKPARKEAEQFLRSGEYYWNSGNFVWRAEDILDAIRRFLPELHAGLERIRAAIGAPRRGGVGAPGRAPRFGGAAQEAIRAEYPALPRISIDFGVLEKAANAVVVEAALDWDDLGSWNAISRHCPADENGNFVLSRHAGLDTTGCIVAGEAEHLIATVGVHDLIIVQMPDATLVCDRNRAADVKALVELLKAKGLDHYVE